MMVLKKVRIKTFSINDKTKYLIESDKEYDKFYMLK